MSESSDIHVEALERYLGNARLLWDQIFRPAVQAELDGPRRRDSYTFGSINVATDAPPGELRFGPLRAEAMQAAAQAEVRRLAEVQDRAEWIEGIRRRLGLVVEVHRCWVWQSVGLWHWWCLRDSCGGAHHNLPSQPEAFADAFAHTRSFVPQPPEPEPWSELDVLAFEAAWDAMQDQQARFAAALPDRIAEVTEQVNDTFAGLLPEGMRFEWE